MYMLFFMWQNVTSKTEENKVWKQDLTIACLYYCLVAQF